MANWPGSAGLPALVARAGFQRKSVQLPFATEATPPESDAPEVIWGSGSPEGVVQGNAGDIYIRNDDPSRLYQKLSGALSTGWTEVGVQLGVPAHTFAGASAGLKIQAAVDALAATGGTIDCRGFDNSTFMLLDVDVCANLSLASIKPYQFLWGPHEVRVTTRQKPRSHHHHTFFGTKFILKDGSGNRVTGSVFAFYTNSIDTVPAGGVVSTNGSANVTMANAADPFWAKLEVGSPLLVNGFVPPVGVDKTTINVGGGIDAVTATITVVSTAAFATQSDQGWPSGGRIRIENEIIAYTSKDATHFLGCTRGAEGTTAAAHVDTTPVNRVSYQPFTVLAINGNVVTLDGAMNINANALAVQIGHLDVSFDGVAEFDGNKDPNADDSNNPMGLWINGSRRVYIGPGLIFNRWDHGGWSLTGCQDCVAYARGHDNGSVTGGGVGFWIFGWNKRITVDALDVAGSVTAIGVDDRSTGPQINDGPAEDSSFRLRRGTRLGNVSSGTGNGILLDGARNCTAVVERATFIAGLGGCNGIHVGGAGQWGDETTVPLSGNVVEVGKVSSPDGTHVDVNVGSAGNGVNTIILKARAPTGIVQANNQLVTVPFSNGLTYGVSVNTNAIRSKDVSVTVTDGVAFTMVAPTNPTEMRRLTVRIQNASGGAMGAITWDAAAFKLAGAFVNPANGQARYIEFRYTGGFWREQNRSAADQVA